MNRDEKNCEDWRNAPTGPEIESAILRACPMVEHVFFGSTIEAGEPVIVAFLKFKWWNKLTLGVAGAIACVKAQQIVNQYPSAKIQIGVMRELG